MSDVLMPWQGYVDPCSTGRRLQVLNHISDVAWPQYLFYNITFSSIVTFL